MTDDLSTLQRTLSELLRQRQAIPRSASASRVASIELTGNDYLSPAEQLEIYREQYWLRHTSSLLEDFPGLSGIVGQQAWERLVEEYLGDNPPDSYTLRDLGARVPDYVSRATWLHPHQLCHDMARLEWAYIEAFDAPDAPPLDPEALARLAPESWLGARIELSPALQLLQVSYPVADLRRQLREAASAGEAVPLPDKQPQYLVIYRLDGSLFHREVGETAHALLSALRAGEPLMRAVEQVLSDVAGAEQTITSELQSWFRKWAELGWVAAVRA